MKTVNQVRMMILMDYKLYFAASLFFPMMIMIAIQKNLDFSILVCLLL